MWISLRSFQSFRPWIWGGWLGGLILIYSGVVRAAPPSLQLLFADQSITLNFQANPELLRKKPQHFLLIGSRKLSLNLEDQIGQGWTKDLLQTEFVTRIDRASLEQYLRRTALPQQESIQPVKITQTSDGAIDISARPTAGYFVVDFLALEALINKAFERNLNYVRVPSEEVYTPVSSSPDLVEKGIQEVIAIGKSNFTGSSPGRRQNILAGARKFDGLLLKKGERFSFNHALKSVKESDGFVRELVIKGNTTEKELGGGVCQVSTTVYRAAFKAGLPILSRRAHSYAVPYYQPHGLDATIYLGGQDFVFRNDTPGDILIQSFVEKDDLYFVFYGTRDERQVVADGPFISHYKPAPEPQIFQTEELPEGLIVEASPSHDGFTSKWVRRVINNGQLQEDIFTSHYRPWPAKILHGMGDPDLVYDLGKLEG